MFVIGSAPSVLKEKPEKMAKSWTKTQVAVYMPYGEKHQNPKTEIRRLFSIKTKTTATNPNLDVYMLYGDILTI